MGFYFFLASWSLIFGPKRDEIGSGFFFLASLSLIFGPKRDENEKWVFIFFSKLVIDIWTQER